MKKIIIALLIVVLALAGICVFTPVLISVNGDKEIHISYDEIYEDEGASLLFNMGKLKTESNLETGKLGAYEIKYSFLFASKKRIVYIEDNVRPVITLVGPEELYIVKGTPYEESGAKAVDEINGDISNMIEISDNIDINSEGEYYVNYIVSDFSGNQVRARRKVIVTNQRPETMDFLSFNLSPYYNDVICKETEEDIEKYESLILFGDSFIGRLGDQELASYSHLWSRGSLSTDDFYELPITVYGHYDGVSSFFDAMDKHHPKAVMILLNSDWTGRWTVDYLEKSCDKAYQMLKEKYPDTQFIVCSLMPVSSMYGTEDWVSYFGFNRNDRINKMNARLCELCRKYDFKFLNAAEAVKNNANGACRDEYISDDYIHLSYAGNLKLIEYIRTHLDY